MNEWKKVKLKDCCHSISDGDHLPPPKSNSGVPFVTIANIDATNHIDFGNTMFVPLEYYNNLNDIRKAKCNDILYSVVGSFGKPVLIKENIPFAFQRHIAILRPNNEIADSRFLYYVMLTRDFFMQADTVAIGAAQRTISLTALRNMEVKLPSMETQHRIASILSRYDSLIENYQKQIKLLEEAAQRLYKEWFIDLHFPGHENTKIVDGVPEGWEKKKISDICQTVGGGTPSTKVAEYYDDGNIKWVTPTDITRSNCLCLFDTDKKITEDGLAHSSAKILPPETILMTSRASVGYFGIYDCEVCTNQGFISCIPNERSYQMYMLYNLINRVEEIRQKAGGSTYLEISKSVFRDFDIVLPSCMVLETFQEQSHKMLDCMRQIAKQLRLLTEARDRLLPKLMSGAIEV